MLCHMTILKLPGLMRPHQWRHQVGCISIGVGCADGGAATVSCGRYFLSWKLQSVPETAVSSRSWEEPQVERTGKLRAPQREH